MRIIHLAWELKFYNMSNIQRILVLTKEDLAEQHKDKTLEEIGVTDFKYSVKQFHTEPFVIFVDNTLGTKLLKNRYGNDGIVK